jgi:hypothetical protein
MTVKDRPMMTDRKIASIIAADDGRTLWRKKYLLGDRNRKLFWM